MQIGFRSPRKLRTLIWARIVLAAVVLSLGTGGIAFAAKHGHKSSTHGTAGHGSVSITHMSWGTPTAGRSTCTRCATGTG